MSNDSASGEAPGGIPEPVSRWLSRIAAERGVTEGELLRRLLSEDASDAHVADLGDRVEELEAAIDELDDDLDAKIQDVRERVVQVKREADAKAPADHDHPEIDEAVATLAEEVSDVESILSDLDDARARLDERVDGVDRRMAEGFENYETVLEYLVGASDDHDEKLRTLAGAVADLRDRAVRLDRQEARRTAVDRLRRTASEHDVARAKCEECGETVDLRLLSAPACPHCEARFAELEPKSLFFRRSVLRTGSRPALEGDVQSSAPDGDELEDLAEAERESAPEIRGSERRERDERREREDSEGGPNLEAAEPEGEPSPDDGGSREMASGLGGPADEEVANVPGIGSAYAERLHRAGIETVGDLAFADVDRLADRTDIAPGRIEKWVDHARSLVDDG